eukprot:scaffold68534_cov24-Phaeocystis_antarctica.AAC.1
MAILTTAILTMAILTMARPLPRRAARGSRVTPARARCTASARGCGGVRPPTSAARRAASLAPSVR